MSVEESDRFRTGIEIVDERLGGGIPRGTITVLSADPASQSELFLYEFAGRGPAVYLSAVRAERTVERTIENRDTAPGRIEVIRIDGEAPLAHVGDILDRLPERTNLLVDAMTPLEECGAASYRSFLADLGERATERGGVVFLHCLREEYTPERRRETLHAADLVFDLDTEVRGDSVVNRLTVPKFRGGQSMKDVAKLDLTSGVEVDMSRNII